MLEPRLESRDHSALSGRRYASPAFELRLSRRRDYMASQVAFYMHSEAHLILIMMTPLPLFRTF